ncbi:MAG: hypothetical protein PHQ12_15085 [Chthoniobacteraceae bacterium]|nr:hypothetical protein [Chthoniobacteraceae bacterium]
MIARLLTLLCLGLLAAARPAASAPPPPQTYALLVGGLAGKAPYDHWYEDWLGRFQTHLTRAAGVPPGNITVLSGTGARADAVTAALGGFAQRVKPQDQFILFLVGHGEIGGPAPALVLPGPDLTASQLAAALKAITSHNQVILNFSASSGDFLAALAASNRINITATSPTESEEPVFAEFFLRGLESKRAGAGQEGSITLLNAYNWAARETALWIARWTQIDGKTLRDKTWKASGRETIEIFEKLYPSLSSRKLDPSSNRKAEDAAVELLPPNGEVTKEWSGRRVIDEHPMIEDCGKEVGVTVLGEKGLQPIAGEKPKDPGYLAAHTILGKPASPDP